jgi:hypothetical protein
MISWFIGVMENNKLDLQCNELIEFFIMCIIIATKGEMGYFTQFCLHINALQFGLLFKNFYYIVENLQMQLFLCH